MKRGRPSGWMLNNRRMQQKELVPVMVTRWERFLWANKIADPLLALKNGKRKLITEWVHKHHDNAFIPENVLEYLSVTSRWEN